MKKHMNIFIAVAVTAIFAATAAHAQELMYEQRENQVSYDGGVGDVPALVFNGKDFAAFYAWAGVGDANSGLYMRRINSDGKPFGPQRKLLATEFDGALVTAVWDGSAYIVFLSSESQPGWKIVRVNSAGKVLGTRSKSGISGQYLVEKVFSFAVGDNVFLFFSTYTEEDQNELVPYMIMIDRMLKQEPTLTILPTGDVELSMICGVALDPEKFVVLLGATHLQGSLSSYFQHASLLHVGFDGAVKKSVQPVSLQKPGADPAEQIETADLRRLAGPFYTGNGYLIAGTRNYPVPGASYPFINTSMKIDDTGELLSGPYNLGGTTYYYLGRFFQLGRQPALAILDYNIGTLQLALMGSKGKHIRNVDVIESRTTFPPEVIDADYFGRGSAVLTSSRKSPTTHTQGSAIYSNIISEHASAKPGINYLQVSSNKAFGDTRRLVMWSVVSGSKVSLSGPKLKLKNLPPVFHTVVDTKGKKTKLRLRYTGTDGKARKSKLVIKP